MDGLQSLSEVAPAAIGAAAGSSGAFWIAKILFNRMLNQYDKRHDEHTTDLKAVDRELTGKIDTITARINDATQRVAVLEAVLDDARRLRIEVEQRVTSLRAELETRHSVTVDEVYELRDDVFVAHERVRLLAKGETDLTKVVRPSKKTRR